MEGDDRIGQKIGGGGEFSGGIEHGWAFMRY